MTLTVHDLIEQLRLIEDHYGGELPVVTDSEQSVSAVEYNDTEGAPACVLVIDVD